MNIWSWPLPRIPILLRFSVLFWIFPIGYLKLKTIFLINDLSFSRKPLCDLKILYRMARADLNKRENLMKNTTAALKYIPKRLRICINWNPPFQTKLYLLKVPLNVNIVKQDLLNKNQFLKILWSVVWKGGFQLMQILGLLGMYFDAVVVEVEKCLLFSDWLWPYCVITLCYFDSTIFLNFVYDIDL